MYSHWRKNKQPMTNQMTGYAHLSNHFCHTVGYKLENNLLGSENTGLPRSIYRKYRKINASYKTEINVRLLFGFESEERKMLLKHLTF